MAIFIADSNMVINLLNEPTVYGINTFLNFFSVLPSLTAYFPPTMYPLVGEQIFLDLRLSAGSISWYKDAVNIAWLPITRLSISPNGSLLVRNVTGVDDGLYQAFAWTSAGEVSTSPVRIHVVGKVQVSVS